MPDAIAEPPQKTEPAKKEPEKKGSTLLDSVKVSGHQNTPPTADIITQPTETKEPEKKEEPKAETKVSPPVDDEAELPDLSDEDIKDPAKVRENFRRSEAGKKPLKAKLAAAREEAAKLKAKAELADAHAKRVAELEAQQQESAAFLRSAALERTPEFVEEFVKGRENRLTELGKLAGSAEATAAEFQRALDTGDEDKLAEWREALTPRLKAQWDAHRTAIADLDYRRELAKQNADKTWQGIQEQRKAALQRQQDEAIRATEQTATSVISKIFDNNDALRDDAELRADVEKDLRELAGGRPESEQWTTERIMANVAFTKVQKKIMEAQDTVIKGQQSEMETLKSKIAELEKKIADQDTFIQGDASRQPRSDVATNGTAEKSGSLLDRVRVSGISPG